MIDPLFAARTALNLERRHITAEIAGYPRPVSGCDAQFNYLLDIRRRLERALAELEKPEPVPTSRQPF
jgi:hypothetical protein